MSGGTHAPLVAAPAMVRLVDVHKHYREGGAQNHVLRGVSLTIAPGEMVALTGASGSGKTTLLNLIGGLDQRYTGDVEIAGERLRGLPDKALSRFRNHTVGYIFQHFHLLGHLPVVDNVAMPGWFARSDSSVAARAKVLAVLEKVGLGHKLDARPSHLSGGEKQRVAIARALYNEPKLLLCDEPTGALDSETTGRVFDLIRALHAGGLTVIVVTHERDIADRCPRRVVLKDGQIVSDTAVPSAAAAAAPGGTP